MFKRLFKSPPPTYYPPVEESELTGKVDIKDYEDKITKFLIETIDNQYKYTYNIEETLTFNTRKGQVKISISTLSYSGRLYIYHIYIDGVSIILSGQSNQKIMDFIVDKRKKYEAEESRKYREKKERDLERLLKTKFQ